MTQAPAIPIVTLPGDVAMPMLGLGTWRLRGRAGQQAMAAALEAGYRHIDTATMYGNEAEAGRAVAGSGLDRSEVFITSKLPSGRAGRERATLSESLRALGTSYLDLWLVHWPPAGRTLVPVWQELLALRDEGRARAVGVSNYSLAQIDRLIEVTGQAPAVNQIPWSPRRHDAAVLAGHRERGVTVMGYSPLKGSQLTDPVLTGIAGAHGVSPAQVVLKWHLAHGVATVVKSADPGRIADNIGLARFSLSEEEIGRIDSLSRER
ncbi:MAG: aldo/keto reductase [Nocardiopsaceae bacterium]|jgi:diketogulonate reductase-like aldo/keto reductase|nr:aldo/keto reductase [Nocardiopsaceae bacterium]